MKGHGPDSLSPETKISAVILDLDGTILNTEKATESVLEEFLAKYGKEVDPGKEENRLGQMHNESAASIVKDYDLPLTASEFSKEIMPMYTARWPNAKALPGANRLISHLHKHKIPFALASNSKRENIGEKLSHHKGWTELFSVILGSDQVKSGKPSPDLFLEAAKRMGVDAAHCLVIEDSLVGVRASKNAGMKVVAVPSSVRLADCYSIADCVLHSLLEFQPELWGLPEFKDWVQNALPIEPLHVKGLLSGIPNDSSVPLSIIPDRATAVSLPDQVSGVYFGWAILSTHGIFKAVVSIGWELRGGIANRVIQACLLGEFDKDISGEQLELWIVGYIRQLCSEANASTAFEIFPEDKSNAEAALDLPIFSYDEDLPIFSY
ncbi:bifunctional riboflavin kinase/FMN phosphatase-like [Magnolia sinica]|uniref:bifunctional riboflavin kinase/FMN phosphatase-like n=1 Tax=Magnolia sinica TaxID=86752 RepID=UPI0026588A49|nr:bifunctional riboflavin kinase/FMN phosphatase-like [Magnolia sinica]